MAENVDVCAFRPTRLKVDTGDKHAGVDISDQTASGNMQDTNNIQTSVGVIASEGTVRLKNPPVIRLEAISRLEFVSITSIVLIVTVALLVLLLAMPPWLLTTSTYVVGTCTQDDVNTFNTVLGNQQSCVYVCDVRDIVVLSPEVSDATFCGDDGNMLELDANATLICPYDDNYQGMDGSMQAMNETNNLSIILMSTYTDFEPLKGDFDVMLYITRPPSPYWDGQPYKLPLKYTLIMQAKQIAAPLIIVSSLNHSSTIECGGLGEVCEVSLITADDLGKDGCADLFEFETFTLQVAFHQGFSPFEANLNLTVSNPDNGTSVDTITTIDAYASSVSVVYVTVANAFLWAMFGVHVLLGVGMLAYTIIFIYMTYTYTKLPFRLWIVERKWAVFQCLAAVIVASDPVYYMAVSPLIYISTSALTTFIAVDELIVNLCVGLIFFFNLCFLQSFFMERHVSTATLRFYMTKLVFLSVWVAVVLMLCSFKFMELFDKASYGTINQMHTAGSIMSITLVSSYFGHILWVGFINVARFRGEWSLYVKHRQIGVRVMLLFQSMVYVIWVLEGSVLPNVWPNRVHVDRYNSYTGFSTLFVTSFATNVLVVLTVFSTTYGYLPPSQQQLDEETTEVSILNRSSHVHGVFSLYTAHWMRAGSRFAYKHTTVGIPSRVPCGTTYQISASGIRETEGSVSKNGDDISDETSTCCRAEDREGDLGDIAASEACSYRSKTGGNDSEVHYDGQNCQRRPQPSFGLRDEDALGDTKPTIHSIQSHYTEERRDTSERASCSPTRNATFSDDMLCNCKASVGTGQSSSDTTNNEGRIEGYLDREVEAGAEGKRSLAGCCAGVGGGSVANDKHHEMPGRSDGNHTTPEWSGIPHEGADALPTEGRGGHLPGCAGVPASKTTFEGNNTNYHVLEHVCDLATDTHFLLYTQDDNLVISFRGTKSKDNAVTDLRASLIPTCADITKAMSRSKHSCMAHSECRTENVLVHQGFLTAFASVRDRLLECVREQIERAKHNPAPRTNMCTECGDSIGPEDNIRSKANVDTDLCTGMPKADSENLHEFTEIEANSSRPSQYGDDQATSTYNSRSDDGVFSSTNRHTPLHLFITGHSLGGALATLCAFELARVFTGNELELTVYTFGSPRVGNSRFATQYNHLVPNTHRLVNDGDPVCGLPKFMAPEFLNITYKHVGTCYVIAERGDMIINPSFPERMFQLRSKRILSQHSIGSYRTGILRCLKTMTRRLLAQQTGEPMEAEASYQMGTALQAFTTVLSAPGEMCTYDVDAITPEDGLQQSARDEIQPRTPFSLSRTRTNVQYLKDVAHLGLNDSAALNVRKRYRRGSSPSTSAGASHHLRKNLDRTSSVPISTLLSHHDGRVSKPKNLRSTQKLRNGHHYATEFKPIVEARESHCVDSTSEGYIKTPAIPAPTYEIEAESKVSKDFVPP